MSASGVAEGVEVTPGEIEALRGATTHPCPHGCTSHAVPSLDPTACGHYHSPDEWGHHEQIHNSAYWKAIGSKAAS